MSDDFYETDEPVGYVVAAFNAGDKRVTAPPAGQTVNLGLPTAEVAGEAWRKHVDEIETLRQELDDHKARLRTACEQRDTWRTMHHEVEQQRDALRTAARHVVDCYRHDNLMGVVVGVDKLAGLVDP